MGARTAEIVRKCIFTEIVRKCILTSFLCELEAAPASDFGGNVSVVFLHTSRFGVQGKLYIRVSYVNSCV